MEENYVYPDPAEKSCIGVGLWWGSSSFKFYIQTVDWDIFVIGLQDFQFIISKQVSLDARKNYLHLNGILNDSPISVISFT